MVSISYSTAKKVFSRFRKALKPRPSVSPSPSALLIPATFLEVEPGLLPSWAAGGVQLVSTIAGREQVRPSFDLLGKK
jgi:hypothetical protein